MKFKLKNKQKKFLDNLSMWLVAIGGLNWGLAVFDFNAVTWLANLVNFSMLSKIVYGAVGLSAIWLIGKSIKK